ncbi:MAG: hypothetical protein K6V73_00860 [Firmicutes bacterium]|nr:hypothetical protein [Bacillota bacterium]
MAAMTLTGDARTVMESMGRFMNRDYARAVGGEDLLRWTGLEPRALAEAVRALAERPHPYVRAVFHPDDPDRLVEVRLTVDGEMYCRSRD